MRVMAAAVMAVFAAVAPPVPPQLAALLDKAHLTESIAEWCQGTFRSPSAVEYAVAVRTSAGGRYIVLDRNAGITELGAFARGAQLSCYSPAEARKLAVAIRNSETISGELVPRWRTTVICGFTDNTSATCWQYSPREKRFVQVGRWIT